MLRTPVRGDASLILARQLIAAKLTPTTSMLLPDGTLQIQRHEIFDDWTRIRNEWMIVRGDRVVIAHHDTVIESDDHVILFMTDRRTVERIEQLFQVGVSFI